MPFDDPTAFAKGILQLLDNPDELAAAALEARRIGAGLAWPSVGAMTVDVLRNAQGARACRPTARSAPVGWRRRPSIRSDHLLTLVDDVGIVQHADGVVPNRASGYCVDDVARLVIVALGLDREADDRTFSRMVTLGLSFLRYAWDPARPGHAQHDVLRPAVARRTAQRRPSRPGRLGPRVPSSRRTHRAPWSPPACDCWRNWLPPSTGRTACAPWPSPSSG